MSTPEWQSRAMHPPAPVQTAKIVALAMLSAAIFSCLACCMVLFLFASMPNPIGLALVSLAAIVPAIFYSLLVSLLDRFEAEPWYMMLGAFLWGAVVATFFSLIANTFWGVAVFAAWGETAYQVLVPIFVAPPVEETMKGAALVVLLLAFRHELDGILDGIIYGALVGLGFAMTENVLYFSGFLQEMGVGGLVLGFLLRAGLGGFAHAIFTACTGAGVAIARTRYGRGGVRWLLPFIGLGLAILLHAFWNTMAVAGTELGPIMALLSLVAIFFVVIVPGVLTVILVAIHQWDRQLGILRVQLADEVTRGTLSADDLYLLTTPGQRRRRFWKTLFEDGLRAWLRLRRFAAIASQLAFQKHHRSQGEPEPRGIGKRSESQLRADLVTARANLTARS